MVDITRDKPLQPRTYKVLFISAILLSHVLFYGSVYGSGLRFRAVHGRWPRAMIDQALVYTRSSSVRPRAGWPCCWSSWSSWAIPSCAG
ncbi:MAG: hypothetical protein RL885_13640 [Planctomycetota bacterium]